MSINLVVAITDDDWFEILRRQPNLSEVDFWAPSAVSFRALQSGEMFLFKLHAPRNVIVGGGIFAYANALPCSFARTAFGEANGARSPHEMRMRIARYRKSDPNDRSDFAIGYCSVPQACTGERRNFNMPRLHMPKPLTMRAHGNQKGRPMFVGRVFSRFCGR